MKIAFIIDTWEPIIGGGQKLFWELAKGLVKDHNCEVTIITRALKDKEGKIFNKNQSYFKKKLKIIRLGPVLFWNNIAGRLWFILQAAFYLLWHEFDLIHGSAFLSGITLQIIKFFKKIPETFSAIGFNHFWQETNPGLTGKFFSLLEKIISEKFNYDWVITDDYNFYQKYQRQNISFILNGINLWAAKNEKKRSRFTFLFIGRLDKRKGLNYLLTAFKKVVKKLEVVDLRIIGCGEEESNYQDLCIGLGINRYVKFIGRVNEEQKEIEYKKAHCFVLPSLWEGHPLVLFEAWAAKLPVIATQTGSLEKLIHSSNGYLVPPRNPEKLAQAMIKAAQNKNLAKLGKNGFKLIKNRYNWKKTVKDYFEVFKKVLQ